MSNTSLELTLSSYQQREKAVSAQDAPWLKDLRAKALKAFGTSGFPTTHNESWKYTDLTNNLLKVDFGFEAETSTKTAVSAKLKSLGFETEKVHLMVFVNGHFSKELSVLKALPKGVKLLNMAEALKDASLQASFGQIASLEGHAFTDLNTASFVDGVFLQVPKGQSLVEFVHIVYLSVNGGKNTQSHPRNLYLLEDDSQAMVIEHYLGDNVSPYLTNSVSEVHLSRGSRLDHTKIQQENQKGYHFTNLDVKQAEGSHFTSRIFSFGGFLVRNEVETVLAEKKAECLLEGLYLAKDKQHMDTRTFIDHLSPSCNSQEVFKGVLDGEATGIFDGHILVRENAQKTDARQSNKNLQLTKESKVYSKPQLQIYADDVKCSHGSATGQIDEEAFFYFQSRGISREQAKRALVYAFAGEMVERVSNPYLQTPLRKLVNEWMGEKP